MTETDQAVTTSRPPADAAPAGEAFPFGANWQRYVAEYLTPERERIAAESLGELVQEPLAGRTFLDLGAGSGLFSLGALRLGAASVTSVDIDPQSVASCELLRQREGDPPNWRVERGSILDRPFADVLDPADVVYSWGVLHHTGSMWDAMANAVALVKPGGLLVIAIYNRIDGRFLSSARWLRIKRAYNRVPRPVQRAMEAVYEVYFHLAQIRKRRLPWRVAREYKRVRGMALRTDLIDWLGGYPYEYASVGEVRDFCEREHGLALVRVLPTDGIGNNQFVFRNDGPPATSTR